MKKFMRYESMKEITLPERLKLRLRCSVMAKTRDTVTEIRDKHLYDDKTSTNT
jgi:hypothetical protein